MSNLENLGERLHTAIMNPQQRYLVHFQDQLRDKRGRKLVIRAENERPRNAC